MDKPFPYKSLKITRMQDGLHSSLWWSLPRDTSMSAIHSTKISGNFGAKLNGSVKKGKVGKVSKQSCSISGGGPLFPV